MEQYPVESYPDVLQQLKDAGYNMEVHSTSYTKRIKLVGLSQQMIFSEGETSPYLIKLIESLRNDADNYNDVVGNAVQITQKQSYEIDFYGFIDRDKNDGIIYGTKIDFNKAYWQTGLNIGLISKRSEEILTQLEEATPAYAKKKDVKGARLKALGALATRKVIYTYEGGKLVADEAVFMHGVWPRRRQIYLTICDIVAKAMSDLMVEFFEYCVYYYWDCIFVRETINEEEILAKIKELGYGAKIEGKGNFEIDKDILSAGITFTDEVTLKDKWYPIDFMDLRSEQ